ncbi:hypothetical protein J5N97_011873 [Dioscorea zingiberensis]|uniref:Bulb-type lectin domain-containing protein n=1 Tax=Dioscorea zingiberensis TaxID=325984 RepID=A0A9D5D3W2_9LILI|nr:hypothetical protein J5N97_011873 [Dioscorea zingiberensis]
MVDGSNKLGESGGAALGETGNLVVGEAESTVNPDKAAWQSFDHPTDTLLPGMKLGWDLRTGLNRNLTAWASSSDPAPGPYTMAMDIQGDPQIFLWSGSTRTWRTGPWNGLRYSGIPEMQTYSMFTFAYVENQDEIYYSFNIGDPSIISRLIVNQTGSTQRFVWLNQTGSWRPLLVRSQRPVRQVSLALLDPNLRVCDPNTFLTPICDLSPRFCTPSPHQLGIEEIARDGCVRKTELDCRNRTTMVSTSNKSHSSWGSKQGSSRHKVVTVVLCTTSTNPDWLLPLEKEERRKNKKRVGWLMERNSYCEEVGKDFSAGQ